MSCKIPPTSLSISAHFEDILSGRPSGPLLFMVPSRVFVLILFACRQSNIIITTRKRSLGQGNIFRSVCQEFCPWGEYLGRYTPRDQVQPSPWDQVHPPEQVNPPDTRYTPWDQVHPPRPGTPPRTRYTPQDQVHPLDQVHPPDQVHPQDQVHPLGPGTSPQAGTSPQVQCMLGDTGNKRAVRILLECILVETKFFPLLVTTTTDQSVLACDSENEVRHRLPFVWLPKIWLQYTVCFLHPLAVISPVPLQKSHVQSVKKLCNVKNYVKAAKSGTTKYCIKPAVAHVVAWGFVN